MPDVGEEREGAIDNAHMPFEQVLAVRRTMWKSFISAVFQVGVATVTVVAISYIESALSRGTVLLLSLYLGVVALWLCFLMAAVRVASRPDVHLLDDIALSFLLMLCIVALMCAVIVTNALDATPERWLLALACAATALVWLPMLNFLPAWARRSERHSHDQ